MFRAQTSYSHEWELRLIVYLLDHEKFSYCTLFLWNFFLQKTLAVAIHVPVNYREKGFGFDQRKSGK